MISLDVSQGSQIDWSVEDALAEDVLAIADHSIEWARETDPQRQWQEDTRRFLVWRGGNSIGKTYSQAQDIVRVARGRQPHRPTPRTPVSLLVIGYSWSQMDPLLERLWAYLPKDEIDERLRYEPGNGIRGLKEPCIEFVAGPGSGSRIYLATYKQGAGRIMGYQVHGAYLDEPPPGDVYAEVIPRLNAHAGYLRITFTPTPESPDLEYLRKEIEAGRLHEHVTSLTPDAVRVRGGLADIRRMTQAEIDDQLSRYLSEQRAMREHGAWEPLPSGRWITTFTGLNVEDHMPVAGAWLCVSIDHGANAGKQAAVLSWWLDRGTGHPAGGFLDEVLSDGATTTEQDADAILEMLARNGLTYDDVDGWVGDRETGENRLLVSKSNARLLSALRDRLRRRDTQMRPIRTPHKQHGSVRDGAMLLKNGFAARRLDGRPFVIVHPRCAQFIASLRTFRGGRQEPVKDIFDAGRYGMEAALREAGRPEQLWRGVFA